MRLNSSDLPDLFEELFQLPDSGAEGAPTAALPADGSDSKTSTREAAGGADEDRRSEGDGGDPRRRTKATSQPRRARIPSAGREAKDPTGSKLGPADSAPGAKRRRANATAPINSAPGLQIPGIASPSALGPAFVVPVPSSEGATGLPAQVDDYDKAVAARQHARRETYKQLKRERRSMEGPKPKEPDRLAPPPRYLSVKQVAANIGVSEQSIWRWVSEVPDFPKPLKIGKATRCLSEELDHYVRKQAQSRP